MKTSIAKSRLHAKLPENLNPSFKNLDNIVVTENCVVKYDELFYGAMEPFRTQKSGENCCKHYLT